MSHSKESEMLEQHNTYEATPRQVPSAATADREIAKHTIRMGVSLGVLVPTNPWEERGWQERLAVPALPHRKPGGVISLTMVLLPGQEKPEHPSLVV